MGDECYASLTYSGDVTRLSFLLRDKLEISGLKKVGQDKLLLCAQVGALEDLDFLKSFFINEGIQINNVRNNFMLLQISDITQDEWDAETSQKDYDLVKPESSSTSNLLKGNNVVDINPVVGTYNQPKEKKIPDSAKLTNVKQKENPLEIGGSCEPTLDKSCLERINSVGQILMDKQTSLKPLAALSKDDPICFVTKLKFIVPFLMGSLLMIVVNLSF